MVDRAWNHPPAPASSPVTQMASIGLDTDAAHLPLQAPHRRLSRTAPITRPTTAQRAPLGPRSQWVCVVVDRTSALGQGCSCA